MIKNLFIFKAKLWIIFFKLAALGFVCAMILVQIPELLYDLGPKSPILIQELSELSAERFSRSTFVAVVGKSDFEKGFVYNRYGLSYTYFNISPYDIILVVRTYRKVNDDWKNLNRFLGKLKPFNHQPFYYKIRDIYKEKFNVEIDDDAFFLAIDDVPKISAWQIGAMVFAVILWIVMFYMFFIYKWPNLNYKQEH